MGDRLPPQMSVPDSDQQRERWTAPFQSLDLPNLTLPLIPTCTLDVPSNTSFEVFDVEQGLPLYVSLFWASNMADVLCCIILDPTHQVWLTLNHPCLPHSVAHQSRRRVPPDPCPPRQHLLIPIGSRLPRDRPLSRSRRMRHLQHRGHPAPHRPASEHLEEVPGRRWVWTGHHSSSSEKVPQVAASCE